MSNKQSIDIDYLIDFNKAKQLYKWKKILLFGFRKEQVNFLKKFKNKVDFLISDKIKKNHSEK